eukprot:SAG31_NODE_5705_length_2370_cov_1.543813_1_plen_568_part_00
MPSRVDWMSPLVIWISRLGGELPLVFFPPQPKPALTTAPSAITSKTIETDDSRFVCVSGEPLGVEFASAGAAGGVVVASVSEHSQAWKLGMIPNATVRSVNGKLVGEMDIHKVVNIITEAKANHSHFEIGLSLAKAAEAVLHTLTGRRPEHGAVASCNAGLSFDATKPLGIEFRQVDQQYIVVSGLVDNQQAQAFGVEVGSQLLAVEGRAIESGDVTELQRVIIDAKLAKKTIVVLQFDEHPIFMKEKAKRGEHGLQAWLEALNLQSYVQIFQENAIDDIELLAELTDDNLHEMGVSLLDRAVMRKSITNMTSAPAPLTTISPDGNVGAISRPQVDAQSSAPSSPVASRSATKGDEHAKSTEPLKSKVTSAKTSKAKMKTKGREKKQRHRASDPKTLPVLAPGSSVPFQLESSQADPWASDGEDDALFALALASQIPSQDSPAKSDLKDKTGKTDKKTSGKLTSFQKAQQAVGQKMAQNDRKKVQQSLFEQVLENNARSASSASSSNFDIFDSTLDDLSLDDEPVPTYMSHRTDSANNVTTANLAGSLFGSTDSDSDDNGPGSLFSS